VLLIPDGFGYPVEKECNAIALRQRILDVLRTLGDRMRLTPDHGNAGQIFDKKTGRPHAAHTIHLIAPVYACGDRPPVLGRSLPDPATPMMKTSGVDKPVEMTERSLFAPVLIRE
jgi:2,3-bisphosphoglycerate-independent phosphoglycerate mutase